MPPRKACPLPQRLSTAYSSSVGGGNIHFFFPMAICFSLFYLGLGSKSTKAQPWYLVCFLQGLCGTGKQWELGWERKEKETKGKNSFPQKGIQPPQSSPNHLLETLPPFSTDETNPRFRGTTAMAEEELGETTASTWQACISSPAPKSQTTVAEMSISHYLSIL